MQRQWVDDISLLCDKELKKKIQEWRRFFTHWWEERISCREEEFRREQKTAWKETEVT